MFFSYLDNPDGPVVKGMEMMEFEIAKDQKPYRSLRVLVGSAPHRGFMSRWTLTPEQRKLVMEGADLFIELLTFGNGMQPIRVALGDGTNVDEVAANLGIIDGVTST